jgi:uncharacterized membrane protein YfcA
MARQPAASRRQEARVDLAGILQPLVDQMQAQGISLALLMLPVGVLGVVNYYKAGHIQFSYVLLMAVGFIVGNYFGSKYAMRVPEHKIKFFFSVLMLYVAVQMLWKSGSKWMSEFL